MLYYLCLKFTVYIYIIHLSIYDPKQSKTIILKCIFVVIDNKLNFKNIFLNCYNLEKKFNKPFFLGINIKTFVQMKIQSIIISIIIILIFFSQILLQYWPLKKKKKLITLFCMPRWMLQNQIKRRAVASVLRPRWQYPCTPYHFLSSTQHVDGNRIAVYVFFFYFFIFYAPRQFWPVSLPTIIETWLTLASQIIWKQRT